MIALRRADDRADARPPGQALSSALDRRQRDEVPPDVTDGRVVDVVGGTVVGGTVVGAVTGGEPDVAPPSVEPDEPVTGGAVVAGGDVVVVAAVPTAPEPDAEDGADAPGWSRATSTPRNAVAAPASTTNVWVIRRSRRCARARVTGEKRPGGRLMFENPGTRARAMSMGSSAQGGIVRIEPDGDMTIAARGRDDRRRSLNAVSRRGLQPS
jgi:hypothetical protein